MQLFNDAPDPSLQCYTQVLATSCCFHEICVYASIISHTKMPCICEVNAEYMDTVGSWL